MMREHGVNLEKLYFDVPRLRSAYPSHFLSSGIAYAFHPHRDTWYSAPMCQLNWWLPIYPLDPNNALGFIPATSTNQLPTIRASITTTNGMQRTALPLPNMSRAIRASSPSRSRNCRTLPCGTFHNLEAPSSSPVPSCTRFAEYYRNRALQHRLPYSSLGRCDAATRRC